jgi:hypothetical protein
LNEGGEEGEEAIPRPFFFDLDARLSLVYNSEEVFVDCGRRNQTRAKPKNHESFSFLFFSFQQLVGAEQ